MEQAAGMLAGAVVGSLFDPVAWLAIVLGAALGVTRRNWIWLIAALLAVFLIRLGFSLQNRVVLGLPPGPFPMLSGIAGALWLAVAYGVGRLISRRRRGPVGLAAASLSSDPSRD